MLAIWFLITAGAEYGYWEALVTKRQQEILFLRLRDEPGRGRSCGIV